jgi:trimethylamine--corrinoid protein Co-methyltransferase
VPLRCGGALTGSKLADAQGAQESSDALLTACIGGANFILHAAGWLEGGLTMGYEKFVLDCDHLGMMHTFLAGLALDDSSSGLPASSTQTSSLSTCFRSFKPNTTSPLLFGSIFGKF